MSFHSNFARWSKYSLPEHCPVCRNLPQPEGFEIIHEFPTSWFEAHPDVCLKGTSYLMAKPHALELFDLKEKELLNFMKEAQIASKALKKVIGAIKINYEIHGNTIPHLHMHLFPRYLNDPFPGKPIDYNRIDPPVYEKNEFLQFIQKMRDEVQNYL